MFCSLGVSCRCCPAFSARFPNPADERSGSVCAPPVATGPTLRRWKPRKKTKEVHFFNRWPLLQPAGPRFLTYFEPALTGRLTGHPGEYPTSDPHHNEGQPWKKDEFALVDGTPEYLFNSWAPARIKAVVPQAKFVVLLRVCSPPCCRPVAGVFPSSLVRCLLWQCAAACPTHQGRRAAGQVRRSAPGALTSVLLQVSWAPARIKAVVLQARFVVLLRVRLPQAKCVALLWVCSPPCCRKCPGRRCASMLWCRRPSSSVYSGCVHPRPNVYPFCGCVHLRAAASDLPHTSCSMRCVGPSDAHLQRVAHDAAGVVQVARNHVFTRSSVQDPVARIFSAWRMTRLASCKWRHGPCEDVPSFEESVDHSLLLRDGGPCAFQSFVRPSLCKVFCKNVRKRPQLAAARRRAVCIPVVRASPLFAKCLKEMFGNEHSWLLRDDGPCAFQSFVRPSLCQVFLQSQNDRNPSTPVSALSKRPERLS